MKHLLVLICIALLAGCSREPGFDLERVMKQRPDGKGLVYDYVGLTQPVAESMGRYLERIRDKYHTEVVVTAFPSLNQQYTLNQAAVNIFSNWQVGKDMDSRGVLLLLVDDTRQVRLEIGFELEDVFTDLFSGYIEEKQLRPYYSSGHLETGLIAVLEELEARARIKFSGEYDQNLVAVLDARYFSQGGGAAHDLKRASPEAVASTLINPHYPAGRTPQQAWRTMIKRWRDRQRDPSLGVFTPLARLAFRDFSDMADSRYDEEYRTYADKEYQVLQHGDYAVICFEKKDGWDNAPFLLCRTPEGWQFNLVHQRRFIRMGTAPHWGVEFSDHPYMGLLMDCSSYQGQDIPLEAWERYAVDQDARLADAIMAQEALHRADPEAYGPIMALGRLYTLCAMGRKGIKLLQKARALNPDDPQPCKYLAVAHVDAYYQYDSAMKELSVYIERRPEDAFGHNFMGYLYYRKGQYDKAARALETALQLQPDNCYAHYYLARVYAGRHQKAAKPDPRREIYLKRFKEHVARTQSFEDTHPARVLMLNRWLGT